MGAGIGESKRKFQLSPMWPSVRRGRAEEEMSIEVVPHRSIS